jgi:hypothetical protein
MVLLTVCIYLLLLFQGCGKQKFPDYSDKPEQHEEQDAGYYAGKFKALNSHIAGHIDAHALLWTKGQQFYARVVMMRGTQSSVYQQYIHKGDTCPTSKNDVNRNGILELDEVTYFAGPMLIPLDRNLKTQTIGLEWFPRTDREGIYYYSRSGDISDMMKDLRKRDTSPHRGLGKLDPDENLDMDRRTIILYRSSSEIFLPVACAELDGEVDRDYE